jgi:cobyrinic acid a,c-diamide synthase
VSARHCPAVLVAAPASGQGKTTVCAGLARHHAKLGRRVRVFKTGPDFLDPMILERASGAPVYQLDLWMVGEAVCKQMLFDAAGEADLILIEGVMGLFDGKPSSADLAQTFGIPVLGLINANAMAQTFGAIAHGLATYRPELPFAGVIANNVASSGHAELIKESMPAGVPLYGTVGRNPTMQLPDRHLGLVQADEVGDIDERLELAAAAVAEGCGDDLPPAVEFRPLEVAAVPQLLKGLRIGVARDAAFSFISRANLDLLTAMGAEIRFFSPLADQSLPEVDSLWLPGGYPELHLSQLAANTFMKAALRNFVAAGKPLLAECGGMLYLLERLTDKEGNGADLAGIIPGSAQMQPKLVSLGMQAIPLPEGEIRGHTFHHSRSDIALEPLVHGVRQRGKAPGEALYRQQRLTAGYIHGYFPSNPAAVAALFHP